MGSNKGGVWSACDCSSYSILVQDDIADFLHRCNIEGGNRGIFINTDDRGRASGDAYVELESAEDMENALKMHKRDLGSRWVEGVVMVGRERVA